MLGNQSMYQKFFSAKSEKAASRAVVGWVIGTVILESVIVALAVIGSVVFPTGEVHQHPREILAYSALHGLPAVARCAADGRRLRQDHLHGQQLSLLARRPIWSTTSLSATSRPMPRTSASSSLSRLMVVLLGLWALYQSLTRESVLKKSLYAYTIYSAALTPVVLAAFYSRRAKAAGAVAAIGAGTVRHRLLGLRLRSPPSAPGP